MINRPKNALDNYIMRLISIFLSETHSKYISVSLCISISFLLLACASAPPSKTLPQSKVAVSSVDHKNYRKHASNNVDAVKAKLKQAQALETSKEHETVEQLAQQILVDVELIRIRTQRLNVEQEVKQIESGINNLNEELKWREPVQLSPLNQ